MVGEKQTSNMGFKMKSSIQKLCSPLQSAENPADNDVTPELKKYVPGVDGPKYYGGTVPNAAKAAYDIVKTVGKGAKYLYDKTRGKTSKYKG